MSLDIMPFCLMYVEVLSGQRVANRPLDIDLYLFCL
jgi:hypothetical protein